MLRAFGVRSRQIKDGSVNSGAIAAPTSRKRGQGTARGFPALQFATPLQPTESVAIGDSQNTTAKKPVADRNRLGATGSAVGSVVADCTPRLGRARMLTTAS